MAYTLKYYKEFAWTNHANNSTGATRIEILEDGFVGTSVEIDELGSTPIQLRLDNSGDMINATIKKTSLVLSIVDTDQFDYSQFYTSDGKKYKMNLISDIANWTGYLVPQSFSQELGTNGLISITASDGLHLLQGIDYIANKNATLKLADFIADIETKIGLGIFDKSVSLTTDKGDLWQQYIYEGMFLDKNYEECLNMVLTSYGLQIRYWKIFPVTSILSHSFSGGVECLDNNPMVDYLPIIKKLVINQEITTLPNILDDAMVKDVSDLIPRPDGNYSTFTNWDIAYSNGIGLVPVQTSGNAADRGFKKALDKINIMLLTEGLDKPGYYIVPESGSKYRIRKFKSTDLILRFNANFGKLAVRYPGYTLRNVSWSEITWGLYDNFSDRSYDATAETWSIIGRPTNVNANKIRVENPTDSDIDVYAGITSPTGSYCDLELYLFTGKCKLATTDTLEFYSIMSINEISLDGEIIISDKELYNSITGGINVGDNIDVIDYNYQFGDCPIPPPNTSLYYGSALYSNVYDQITTFQLAGNSVNQMQLLANTILYSNGAGRKSVFSGTFSPLSIGNLMFYKSLIGGINCLINSFTLDIRRVKFTDAEFVEIAPFTFTNYTITSESIIGSSDWGGSGGTSGSVGGGGGTVDLSNYVVKTGAASQDIEGDISADNIVSRGAIVAGALNGTLPDDLPVSSPLLYGVSKYDDVTIKINANGQWYVATSGGTVVSFGTEVSGQSIQLIVSAITKTLALAGHTHNYQPLDGDLTAIAALTGTGLLKRTGTDTWGFDTSTYQLYDADLATIAAIADGIGLLKRTGANTWIIDTNVYLTGITKAMVEAVLTGTISSHWHPFISNSDTRSTDYAPYASAIKQGIHGPNLKLNTTDGLSDGGTFHSSIYIHPWADNTGGAGHNLAFTENGNMYFRSGLAAWSGWKKVWHSVNSNLKTVDWSAKNLYGVNGLFDGAVVAGALNGTLPDDLPVATGSLFGVSKYSGLAVQPTAGDVALRTKHYTSPTANTWYNKAYTITYEIGFSSPGSLSAGAYYSSLYLYALPTAKCLACSITVIPYATGTTPPWIGHQLIASATKDSTGYWRVFIYNPTASAVDLTNVKLSIIAQMIE